uniref:Uncharacterized protein n=1 Tax=Moniliophthora roreri TaxID=221103 RepID=A0A0W0EZL3_MONRR
MEDAPVIVASGYADFEPLDPLQEPVYVGICGVDMIVAREHYSSRAMEWGDLFQQITSSLAAPETAPRSSSLSSSNLTAHESPTLPSGEHPPKQVKVTSLPAHKVSGLVKQTKDSVQSDHCGGQKSHGSQMSHSQGGNKMRDKFHIIASDFAPPTPDAWATALGAVNHCKTHPAAGYVLPKYRLILNVLSEKHVKYLLTWIKYRNALIFQAIDTARPPPLWKAQLWRMFLALSITGFGPSAPAPVVKEGELEEGEVAGIAVSHTFTQKQKEIVYQTLSCCTRCSGILINKEVATRSDTHFCWQGKEHEAVDLDDPMLVQEILWELTDLNFQFELLAMDCARHPSSTAEDVHEQELDMELRDEAVRQCFPEESKRIPQWVHEVKGLAASEIRGQAPYLIKLLAVMRSWKGSESQPWVTVSRTNEDLFTDAELVLLER